MEFTDPRYACDCINTNEFFGLFPSWAARSDIEKSFGYVLYWPDEADSYEPTGSINLNCDEDDNEDNDVQDNDDQNVDDNDIPDVVADRGTISHSL